MWVMSIHKVLIVEDDADVQKMYARFFELAKFDVDTASDGAAGVQKAIAFQPGVILLDVMMPTMDGIEALRNLKADDRTKDIDVIMLTNLSDDSTHETCLALGAKGYMVKVDFSPHEIIEQVNASFA